jgi:hypothetical protein
LIAPAIIPGTAVAGHVILGMDGSLK